MTLTALREAFHAVKSLADRPPHAARPKRYAECAANEYFPVKLRRASGNLRVLMACRLCGCSKKLFSTNSNGFVEKAHENAFLGGRLKRESGYRIMTAG